MEKMRAARVVALGKMACELTHLRPPEAGEVLVRTRLAAICGSDLHVVYMGTTSRPGLQLSDMPHGAPGHEGIGIVEESRTKHFCKGDLVLTVPVYPHACCFAEYITLPAAFCIKVPDTVPLDQMLMAQQLGTVIFALRRNAVDVVGKTVMVTGQGSAGMFFAFLLKRAGAAKVIVTDLFEGRLAAGREMHGAEVSLIADKDNVRDAVKDHTHAQGVDYLIEAVGTRRAQLEAVDYLRQDGDLLFFGLPDSSDPIPFNFHDFFRKRLKVGTTYGAQLEPDLVSFKAAIDLIVRGEIDVSKLVSNTLPIEQVDEAMQLAHSAKTTLKVALSF